MSDAMEHCNTHTQQLHVLQQDRVLAKARMLSTYLQLWHLQVCIEAQQRGGLQGQCDEVGQGVPVPVLTEDS